MSFRRSAWLLAVVLAIGGMIGAAPLSAAGPESVAGLASQLSPAVVNIGSSRRVSGDGGLPFPDVPPGSPLREFFDELNPNQGEGDEAMREARSLGSGFIIDASGIVVTNNHVVEGAEEILIYLTDGTRLPATLLGADDKMDLAVLKVDAGRDLPFVEFGDSDSAEVGDWVMAIGNPFGLGGSVTLGIVSARNRDISSGPYDNFIQTDASINQGNSGGPLFDMDGRVVGINTAIIARGGSSLGIGFAVPANLAKPVLDQLAEFGETRRGWLGVGIQDISDDIAASLDRPNTHGAMVVNVTPGGPSEGVLQDGDVILEFNGQPIVAMRDLPRIVAATPVGEAVKVRVLRDGEEALHDIVLGRLETGEELIAAQQGEQEGAGAVPPDIPGAPPQLEGGGETVTPGSSVDAIMGFDVGEMTEAAREQFGIVSGVEGVLITGVTAGTDAEEKGLIAGLVVTEINQRRVASVAEVEDLIGAAREAGRPAVLLRLADPTGTSRFVAVKPR